MDVTTGLILRKITQTDLSVSAHKLATLILDGVSWSDGYNGLPRGTAAFTLAALAGRMGVSRQYLSVLLSELEASELRLEREKPNGKFAPWLFRFAAFDPPSLPGSDMSCSDDRSLSPEENHKTIFTGQIDMDDSPNVFRTSWAGLIRAAKTALPCWNVDTQVIWQRFLAFNRARGHHRVPAGFLLGFMRRWRNGPPSKGKPAPLTSAGSQSASQGLQAHTDPATAALHDQIRAAPTANRQFHASDLCRAIGVAAYEARILDTIRQFGCQRFTAALAVHGQAVRAGEIRR